MSKDILRNKRTATKLRVQLYQQCVVSILLANCETWALTEKLILKLTRFHHDCARSMCKLTRWHHRKYGITMKDILENRLGGLLPIEKIIRVRQLRFLNRVARMSCDRLTFQVLTSQLKATTATTFTKGAKQNTRSTWKKTLIVAGLTDGKNGGKLEDWIPKLQSDFASTIEENLDLPNGSFKIKKPRKKSPFSILPHQLAPTAPPPHGTSHSRQPSPSYHL